MCGRAAPGQVVQVLGSVSRAGESWHITHVIRRLDLGMFRAKRCGQNRCMVGVAVPQSKVGD